MRKLNGVIDCWNQCFSMEKDGEEVFIPLVYGYVRDERQLEGEETYS